jgi:hypothetical protein
MISQEYTDVPDPKPAHTGVAAPPFGPDVYLIVRHDDCLVGLESSRHDAAWTIHNYHDANDYHVRKVPVGMVPIESLEIPERWKQ